MSLSVVIPARDEGGRIARAVEAAWRLRDVGQVLVVDSCSQDSTGRLAERAGAMVLRAAAPGKGQALALGLKAASGEVILLADADLNDFSPLSGLVRLVAEGTVDLAIGAPPRLYPRPGLGLARGVALHGIKLATGLTLTAPLSGQRALTRKLARALQPLAAGWGAEVGMTIDAARLGARIVEVPVAVVDRGSGRDLAGFWHRGKQFADICLALAVRLGR